MERALSAPGKLFVSGEYAVLFGGTARLLAVGPRAGAWVRRRADREVHLVLESGRLLGEATPLGVRWKEPPPPAFHFAARAMDLACRAHGRETLGFELALEPSPAVQGQKLGLGGSARTAVLATEASRYVLEDRHDALKLSLLAHASAQEGKGSGGDVAACFGGGLLRYRRYDLRPLERAALSSQLLAALAKAAPVDLVRLATPRLPMAYAFTGQSASTPALVAAVEATLAEDKRAAFVQRSDALGDRLEEGLLGADLPAVREAATALHRLLLDLGPLETPAMERILAIAAAHGGAGKLSGAGGGDGCLLFAPDPDALAAMLDALKARSVFAFPLSPEAGLRGDALPVPVLREWLGS